jgi:hypothetical protein
MFGQAADLTLSDIKADRKFVSPCSFNTSYSFTIVHPKAFPEKLGVSTHDPFFSVEDPVSWITSLGYQLYVLHDDSAVSVTRWTPDDVSAKELKAYRSHVLIKFPKLLKKN